MVVGHDVPLKFGEGDKLLVAAAALDQVALLIELTPVVGSVLHQLVFSLPATAQLLTIMKWNLDLLPMHIQQMHLHVGKGGSDGLAAATFYLQLHRVFPILLI